MESDSAKYLERVAIFVDGSNFYFGLKRAGKKTTVDFYKLAMVLATESRKLVRLYYYNAPVSRQDQERYRSQQKFFQKLYDTPYLTVRLGSLEKRTAKIGYDELCDLYGEKIAKEIIGAAGEKSIDYFVEKGVDVSITVDILQLGYQGVYDTAILVSADGDYAPAIEAVKGMGKQVEVAFFKNSFSYHLGKACDRRVYLDDLIEKCYAV